MESATPILDELLSQHTIQPQFEFKMKMVTKIEERQRKRLGNLAKRGKLTKESIEVALRELTGNKPPKFVEYDLLNFLNYLIINFGEEYRRVMES